MSTLLTEKEKIDKIIGIKFKDLFSEADFVDMNINKGKAGQLLEKCILKKGLDSGLKDFEDGELKTNKVNANGDPLETIAITQISSQIDNLINCLDFYSSALYQKIENILYVATCREGDCKDWNFPFCIHIDLKADKYKDILKQIEEDYYTICKSIKTAVESGKNISTTSGKYIQIRTKDSKTKLGYHPIFSKTVNRQVSDKNYAFYFKKDFIKAIKALN